MRRSGHSTANAQRSSHTRSSGLVASTIAATVAGRRWVTAAFALARDNGIPIVTFSVHEPGAIPSALLGKATYVMP